MNVGLVELRYPPLAQKIETMKDGIYRQINLVVDGAGKTDQPYMAAHV